MAEPKLRFFSRFFLAFVVYWKILFNREFARGVWRLRRGQPSPMEEQLQVPATEEVQEVLPAKAVLKEEGPAAALQLLGLLQREGRFVDFLQETVANYTDAEIGAAARVVHEGCRRALMEHIKIEPIRSEQEGARIRLEEGFDASAVRVTGNVVGHPPFNGSLVHRGWRAIEVTLPTLAREHDVNVLAPAEVEL